MLRCFRPKLENRKPPAGAQMKLGWELLWMGGDTFAVELAGKLKEIPGGYQKWSHWRDFEISGKLLGYLWNSPGTCL